MADLNASQNGIDMGISRSYQIFLFVLFFGLAAGAYLFKRDEITQNAHADLARYKTTINEYKSWADHGSPLYDKLTDEFSFQFFQYIHVEDGTLNFTHGALINSEPSLFSKLFPLTLSNSVELENARLQVKLDCEIYGKNAIEDLAIQIGVIGVIYLFLAIVFGVLSLKHRKAIRYAADYIHSIPEFSFQAIQASKLNGELRPVTTALTECRTQLKAKLDEITHENEKLTRVVFQDPVTGFGTRVRFTEKLESISNIDKEAIGVMATIKATELNQINQLYGRNSGDDYLVKVVSCIRKALEHFPDSDCYRVSSSDFVIFIHGLALKEATRFLDQLKVLFDEYQGQIKSDSIAYTGLVPFKSGDDPVHILSLAETAIGIAQTLGPNSFHVLEKLNGDNLFGDDGWRIAIEDIIKRQAIKFYHQPIQPCQSEVKLYNELLSRFYNSEGKFLPTATVIAMAERHGAITEIDKIVILNTIRMLHESPHLTGVFGVNISTVSAHQEAFVAWLTDILTKQQAIASRIVFEVNEAGMQGNIIGSYNFVRAVHRAGSRVSVERFGMGFASFKFFREVRPDYIKLDGSYSESIDQDTNNKFFVRMIVDIARRLNIQVIATSVERQEEKLVLEKLLVDGLQGYYVAQPQAIVPISKKAEKQS
ncbi:diguanylate cyclase [Shewanella gelidii]|uniref:Diguanylate cyclase n=2 Tax=Shewanella gelidii TaxID=1642821 RepID=A0A917NBA5_9GAMM|nr:diguanylate cyclase [Shewanella gelidii]